MFFIKYCARDYHVELFSSIFFLMHFATIDLIFLFIVNIFNAPKWQTFHFKTQDANFEMRRYEFLPLGDTFPHVHLIAIRMGYNCFWCKFKTIIALLANGRVFRRRKLYWNHAKRMKIGKKCNPSRAEAVNDNVFLKEV